MDFTYSGYTELIMMILNAGYTVTSYAEENALYGKKAILRHDIDVSLGDAVEIARAEHNMGKNIKSTFFVMISSDFYNVFSAHSLQCIDQISAFGHDIGLHFDEKKYFNEQDWDEKCIVEKIICEKELLQKMTGCDIQAVSMHRPGKKTLDADLVIPGMINTYSQKFFHQYKYLSDSYHVWRENPEAVIRNEKPECLHLLTHPFWYHSDAKTRKETFLAYIADGEKRARNLIEDNLLPPSTTLEESMADEIIQTKSVAVK